MPQQDRAATPALVDTSFESIASVNYIEEHKEGHQQSASIHAEAADRSTQEDSGSEDEDFYDVSSTGWQSDSGKRGVDDSPCSSPRRKIRRIQEQGTQQDQSIAHLNDPVLHSSTSPDKPNAATTSWLPSITHSPAPTFSENDVPTPPPAPPPSTPMFPSQRDFWKDWCKRKRYPNGDLVTGEKFIAFVKELVAPEVHHDREHSHRSILPLRFNTNDYYDGDLPTPDQISSCIDVVRILSLDQGSNHCVSPNLQNAMRSLEVELLLRTHKEQVTERSQKRNIRATHALVVLRKSTKLFRTRDYRIQNRQHKALWFATLRTRLHYAFDYFRDDVSHSITDVLLSHIFPVVSSEGKMSDFLGVAIAKHPKDARNGSNPGYTIFERHPDAAVCPVGSLAFFLLSLFSRLKDHRAFQTDVSKPFFLLNARIHDKPLANLYLQQNRMTILKMLFRGGATTFRGRQYDRSMKKLANELKEFGDIVVNPGPHKIRICPRRLQPCYLNLNPTATATIATSTSTEAAATLSLYKLTGSSVQDGQGKEEQRHHRVYRTSLIPPSSLQRQIFPFLNDMFTSPDWTQWHTNIMTDRPEEEGRPWQTRPVYPDNLMPAIRMAIVLVYLRRVILQDLAVLMAFKGCAGGVDWQHCLFADNAVFSSTGFLEFAADVRAAVKLDEAPVAVKVARTSVLTSREVSVSSASDEALRSSIQAGDSAPAQDDHHRRHQLLGDTAEVTSSAPLPSIVSTDYGSTAFGSESQEPPPEPFQQQSLPEPLQERLSKPSPQALLEPRQEPLQESTREPDKGRFQDHARDASRQGSVTPSSPQLDVARVKKAAARRQAVEDIKTAMVYLDQRARSHTNAVVEFSATAILTIEALQIRMKSLQESLQRFEVERAESKASKYVVGRLATFNGCEE